MLSDDMVFVEREPSFALWGFPRPIHIYSEDAPPGDYPMRMRGNKLKAAVVPGAHALKAGRAALVLLERGDDLELSPAGQHQAVEALMDLDAGFDLLKDESRAVLEALASRGAWRLTLTDDPVAAIKFLESHFAAEK